MKSRLSIQERLKDLRTERKLKLEELSNLTGISKSALGKKAMKRTITKKSIMATSLFWRTSTGCPLITCCAGQKTGSR